VSFERIGEECGVFGVYDNDGLDVAKLTYYGLYALQHRGQESCGIAVNNDGNIISYKDMGLVGEVFGHDGILSDMVGTISVGHVRYSTTGASLGQNAQPLVLKYKKGTMVLAHNGNVANVDGIRHQLEEAGAIFQTTIDSEIIAYMIAKERLNCASIQEAVHNVLPQIKGSCSLVVMSPKKLIGARDIYGLRPLSIGKIKNSYVLSSETAALDAVGAKFVRDVEPGEVVYFDKEGIHSIKMEGCSKNMCVFEYIYFARPDSCIEGVNVYDARLEGGRLLAKQHPVDADMVIGVPDSGIVAAIGYAQESGIPYGEGLVKNRYIGRTFIKPDQTQRELAVKLKLNVLKENVRGKRIVMIDDSIVRGTTSANIVNMLRAAGAKEVHMRVCAPPFLYPCYFGTDIPDQDNLIACKHTVDEIRQMIGADSLGFFDVNSLKDMVNSRDGQFCSACFTGKYPMELEQTKEKSISQKFDLKGR
jgi:amidophosphoribosyltransferase